MLYNDTDEKTYMVRNWTQQFPIRIALHFSWILDGSRSFSRKLERIWNGSVHSGEKSVQFQFKGKKTSPLKISFPKSLSSEIEDLFSDVFAMLWIQMGAFQCFQQEKGPFMDQQGFPVETLSKKACNISATGMNLELFGKILELEWIWNWTKFYFR